MRLSAFQLSADLHKENRAMLLCYFVLTLLWRKVRIHFLKLGGGDGEKLSFQLNLKLGEVDTEQLACVTYNVNDVGGYLHKIIEGAVLSCNNLFPVPLVNVDRVNIIKLLVAANSVHIGVKTVANVEAVLLKSLSFPLCERVNDLTYLARIGNIKADGALGAVQVIVKAGSLGNEERSRHTLQVKRRRKTGLKGLLYKGYSLLRIVNVKGGRIALGNK